MKVYVFSRQRAKKFSYKVAEPTLFISITDPAKDLNVFAPNPNIVSICRLQFDDTDTETLRPDEIIMTEKDAAKIKQYVMAFKDKVQCIVVHCEAGISRSSGVAAAIKKYLTGDDQDIFNDRRFCPNRHCYRLTLNALFDIPIGSAFGEIE